MTTATSTTPRFTPGPWRWAVKEWDRDKDAYYWRDVDPATFKSTGYSGNPQLVGSNAGFNDLDVVSVGVVVSAGDGEYYPLKGDTDVERAANGTLIAAAPLLYAAASRALDLLASIGSGEWLPGDWADTAAGDDLRAALAAARGEKL